MALYQRVSKLAFLPAGGAAASILIGNTSRCTSTNQKMNQLATKRLTGYIAKSNYYSTMSSLPIRIGYHQRRLLSTIPKELENSTASSSSSAKSSKGFVQWYEGHLQARPVTTKAITGSILWGLGDIVAQVVPTYFADDDTTNGESESVTTTKKEFKYDFPRTGKAVLFGFALHAPLSHLHFNFLEWMTVKSGLQGLTIPIFKTIMEQFVYWSWISNSLYHGAMGFMNGMNFQQTYDRIADVLWDTQVAQWSFWIPVQLLNFQFVPVRHQLNVVLLTSVVWTALLSAWYPPEEKEDDDKVDEKKE